MHPTMVATSILLAWDKGFSSAKAIGAPICVLTFTAATNDSSCIVQTDLYTLGYWAPGVPRLVYYYFTPTGIAL